ncbi:MAG: pilus assembly protein PilM [Phycisphaerae bacterium]
MVFGFLKTRVNPIAVDIGTDSVKMLQTEPGGGSSAAANVPPNGNGAGAAGTNEPMHLVAAASADIPDDLRRKPKERADFVAEAIRKLLLKGGFKGTKAVTCLPAGEMAVQHLRMAKMSDEELRKALPFEAQGKLPFDPGRAVLRHVVAGEVFHETEMKSEVILMAASRESVERHLGILDKAKLEVVGIHVEPSALIECFGHIFNRKGDENISTMFIDMGAGSTHVVIAHGRHLVFAKHVQVGGEAFTRRVAEVLKQTPTAAKDLRIKIAHANAVSRMPAGIVAISASGLGSNGNGHAKPDPDLVARVLAALEEPLDILGTELELCVRYYESIFAGKSINRVIFLGGESRNTALCQKVAQRLGLPATLGDPLARLGRDDKSKCDIDTRTPQPGWAVAVGLGLGVTGE